MNVIYSIGLVSIKILVQCRSPLTFNPYCNFATTGLSEMKVNNFRLMGKGRGMIKPMKTAISKTRRQKTYTQEAMVSIQILITEGSHGSARYKDLVRPATSLDSYKTTIVQQAHHAERDSQDCSRESLCSTPRSR